TIETTARTTGGADTIYGEGDDDVLIGGAAGDRIDGGSQRDLIFGDNVPLDRSASLGDPANPRFRDVGAGLPYHSKHNPAGAAAWKPSPDGTPVWTDFRITLLDHDDATQAAGLNNFGNDYIAGGADDDQIFGELGNDTIQGDGTIDLPVDVGAFRTPGPACTPTTAGCDPTGALTIRPSVDNLATDGDDYIEGGGGNDVIFGNLGQDDILGDSSDLFSLTTPSQRPAGSDLIFGGSGTRTDRNDAGDTTAAGHANDADAIAGDNADIFRV